MESVFATEFLEHEEYQHPLCRNCRILAYPRAQDHQKQFRNRKSNITDSIRTVTRLQTMPHDEVVIDGNSIYELVKQQLS